MKRILIVGAVVLVAIAALAIGGLAYAQTQTPPQPDTPFGRGLGMMGGRQGHQGMMGGAASNWMQRRAGKGQLQAYMEAALAEAFGMTTEEFQAAQQEGKSLWEIAKEQNLTVAEFQAKMEEARKNALEKAVADGVITQEQADQFNAFKEGRGERREKMSELHDLMQAAVAAEFGLTVEELEAQRDAGKTMMDYAVEQGLTVEEFEANMTAARTNALDQAVADGLITQEQADWMLEHMGPKGMMGRFGGAGCMGRNGNGRGIGPRMRMFSPPAGPNS